MAIFVSVIKVIFVIVCALLVMGVLFSHQKSEGLSGIMGGMSQSQRGTRGMDEGMRRIINWLFGIFLLLAVIIDMIA